MSKSGTIENYLFQLILEKKHDIFSFCVILFKLNNWQNKLPVE